MEKKTVIGVLLGCVILHVIVFKLIFKKRTVYKLKLRGVCHLTAEKSGHVLQ